MSPLYFSPLSLLSPVISTSLFYPISLFLFSLSSVESIAHPPWLIQTWDNPCCCRDLHSTIISNSPHTCCLRVSQSDGYAVTVNNLFLFCTGRTQSPGCAMQFIKLTVSRGELFFLCFQRVEVVKCEVGSQLQDNWPSDNSWLWVGYSSVIGLY